MNENKLTQFSNQQCINLETYKKSGKAVQTPVWFVEHNGALYVDTSAKSGKVKRLHSNPHVRLVPCEFRGQTKGEWVEGEARFADEDESKTANNLLRGKYGLQMKFTVFLQKLHRSKRLIIAVQIK